METRPKVKLPLSKNDKMIEVVGWIDLFALWVVTILLTTKMTIFLIPIIATTIFLALTILIKYPYLYNYPVRINNNNALKQYSNATRMIRFLKMSIVCLSILMLFGITGTLKTGNDKAFGIILIPLTFVIILGPVIIFISRSFKLK
ncbi:MAG: hypothetical protein M0P47_13035 [Bacteroidales bacterium]|nr:hypothetical protein [Bacteroidales bacterium]